MRGGGIPTRRTLGGLQPGGTRPDLNRRTLDRLRNQARIQVEGEDQGKLLYELIEPVPEEPGRGLPLRPATSPLDPFSDLAAVPLLDDGGPQ